MINIIPKKIYYAWFGHAQYPERFNMIKENWQALNPEFDIIEINESNFDVNKYEYTRSAYKMGKWAFVSDVARIWTINEFGGFYLDVDVEVLKSFEPLTDNNQVWGKEDAGMVASGLMFGSEPHDKILSQILSYYEHFEFDNKNLFENTTVRIISNILKNHGLRNGLSTDKMDNGAIVYAPKYFAPLHYWGGGKISQSSYSLHYYDGNWVNTHHNRMARSIRYIIHQLIYYVPFLRVPLRNIIDKLKEE